MSLDPVDPPGGAPYSAETLLAAAAAASMRVRGRSADAAHDLFRAEQDRIDDAVRAAFGLQLARIVDTVATELMAYAGRSLAAAGHPELAMALTAGDRPYDLLVAHELLGDADLIEQLLGRIEIDAIADRLQGAADDDPERPSLLARMVEHPDRVVGNAARALLAADSRRRDAQEGYPIAHSDLSAECQHRLTWQIAAVLRGRGAHADRSELAALDSALADAVRRSLRAYDEGDRIETAAMRMATALDPAPAELGTLLLEALGDRRIALFIAFVARALGSDYAAVRALVLDRDGDRLWVALRALNLPRTTLAQIGFVLSEADPRRDLDRFVDRLDPAMLLSPDDARAALMILRADPVYRDAVAAMAQGRGV
ncbi:DUF2336 domain-containing protein [Sphingomonas japonica]|uniref:DUF2336 domain-containing protein n=1 Tax=Sphingomonas japonica TaxID=511662 RepID=A0ABX0U5C2_9SPHN|nr:DUF2336 domain-containing protein [Sphingomonas japonica]NIJ24581.1 hypothetical protein [Sphingomonas japonica]